MTTPFCFPSTTRLCKQMLKSAMCSSPYYSTSSSHKQCHKMSNALFSKLHLRASTVVLAAAFRLLLNLLLGSACHEPTRHRVSHTHFIPRVLALCCVLQTTSPLACYPSFIQYLDQSPHGAARGYKPFRALCGQGRRAFDDRGTYPSSQSFRQSDR